MYNSETRRQRKEQLKEQYPAGTRVELYSMCNDEPGMPVGLRGTVRGIDDQPALLMSWDNNRSLSLLPGDDHFRKLTPDEVLEESRQEQGGMTQGM